VKFIIKSLRQLEELTHRLEHQPVGYKRKKKIQSDQLKDRQEGNDGNDGNGELLVVKSMSDVDETSSVSSVGSNRSDKIIGSPTKGKNSRFRDNTNDRKHSCVASLTR